jgi:hypothetical protein
MGDYAEEYATAASVGIGLAAGFAGVDIVMDVRDLSHSISNWKWSWSHVGKTALNAVGVVPVIGMVKNLKYLDDVAGVAKNADEGVVALKRGMPQQLVPNLANVSPSRVPGICFAAGTPVLVTEGAEDPVVCTAAVTAPKESRLDKVLACATLVVGLGGWYADERRTRRKRKQWEIGMDRFDEQDAEDDFMEGFAEDDSAGDLGSDAFLEDLGEEAASRRWHEGSDDNAWFAADPSDQGGGTAVVKCERATAVRARSYQTEVRLPKRQIATPAADVGRSRRPAGAKAAGNRWGRWWLAFCVLLACTLVGKAFFSPTVSVPVEDRSTSTTSSPQASRSIENIRVGQRVVAENPDPGSSARTADLVVDPATWRLLRLRAEDCWADGTLDVIEIQTLQPPQWIEEHQAQPGSLVPLPLDLLEMGLPETLQAEVLANEPCPAIESGLGCVVLTTVNHLNPDLYELTLADEEGREATVRPTGLHKFYSADRGRWVNTEEIGEGERLRGKDGWLRVVESRRVAGVHRVYNMTVAGEHVFHVSSLGLLSHNNNPCARPAPTGSFGGVVANNAQEAAFLQNAAGTFGGSSVSSSGRRFSGNIVIQRSDIPFSVENVRRMASGNTPFVRNRLGEWEKVNLHHVGRQDGKLIEVFSSHNAYNPTTGGPLHIPGPGSPIRDATFTSDYWKQRLQDAIDAGHVSERVRRQAGL